MDRQAVFAYIKDKYGVEAEYPWMRYDTSAVFRHADNRKWFALVMSVEREKLGLEGEESVDVVNLKTDDAMFHDILVQQEGILPAYHMNKFHWISVLLDGTVEDERVFALVDMSFSVTASVKKKKEVRAPKEWIVPANPKYFDVVSAMENAEEIHWKQGAGIKTGDTVFLYVGAPVSAILYHFRVLETDIPYRGKNPHLTIRALMKLRLVKRYPEEAFTFAVLKEEYGIRAVRGPRGIPDSLSDALQ